MRQPRRLAGTIWPRRQPPRVITAWSEEAWTRRFHWSLRGGAPYHPNATGMAAIADLAAAALSREG